MFNPFRFGFDMLYSIFMGEMLNGIITGIMIDTFASQRDRRNCIELDKKGVCFICGITRETLEKESVALDVHYREQRHYLWNFVFYEYYLHHKELMNETFTGLEYIIRDQIDKDDASWIPLEADEGADISSQLESVHDMVNHCTKAVMALQASSRE